VKPSKTLLIATALTALGGCAKKSHDLDESGGVVIRRSSCPAVAVPVNTGDVTLFNPANSRDARAIDLVVNITHLRTQCSDEAVEDKAAQGKALRHALRHNRSNVALTGDITTTVNFDVEARRTDPSGARDVVLPYFSTVVQGGKFVVSKRINTVRLHFNDGQLRTSSTGDAGASIDRSAATLPLAVITRVNKKRKSGSDDAAIDPLSDPAVREQISRATFELLIGFQLTNDQLQYNATR